MAQKGNTVSPMREATPPDSVRQFAAGWKTVSQEELWPDAPLGEWQSIYSQHWYRAVAAIPRGGRLMFAYCRDVVIPESDGVAKAIRQHPRLKGYLVPNAPPGLLLIKPDSDPGNFLQRCRELGFEVDWR